MLKPMVKSLQCHHSHRGWLFVVNKWCRKVANDDTQEGQWHLLSKRVDVKERRERTYICVGVCALNQICLCKLLLCNLQCDQPVHCASKSRGDRVDKVH